ncbi:MAG: hypothetical protein IK143_02830 [Bacteroidales bacterium]|nr:hypothetical protein [Bacteroidales bacterium]
MTNNHSSFNTVGLLTLDNRMTVDFYTKAFGFTTDYTGMCSNARNAKPA